MNKVIFSVLVWLSVLAGRLLAGDFTWEIISAENLDFRAVAVDNYDNRIIFAGQSGYLLKSDNAGKDWRRVLSIRGRRRNINTIMVSSDHRNLVYAASDSGLYRSVDAGEHWVKIFRGKNEKEGQCNTIGVWNQLILVGTKAGLLISRDNGRSWYKQGEGLSGQEVYSIDLGPGENKTIYLAAEKGVFKSLDAGVTWERIFSVLPAGKEDTETVDPPEDCLVESRILYFVKADKVKPQLIYLATAQGVYQSLDQGKSWKKLTEYGLLDPTVKMLAQPDSLEILALTGGGVFEFQNERWQEYVIGLAAGKLGCIFLDRAGNIYLAGEKGIYRGSPRKALNYSGSSFLDEYLKTEPDIRRVQEEAIRYAELSPEKIARWRKEAARKAWLPRVSVGLDRNSTDLWHWEGGSTTKNDDDILRRGKDTLDWDVSLSWDLSELIWNEAQSAIDVRSKLMVELREDILDQVNKLYFERLRVRSELDNLAMEDRPKRFQKQLRLKELTASLDALTSGFYSEQLRLSAVN
jgi:photosystem II stability/assembly factor-like uncharacterized protein